MKNQKKFKKSEKKIPEIMEKKPRKCREKIRIKNIKNFPDFFNAEKKISEFSEKKNNPEKMRKN